MKEHVNKKSTFLGYFRSSGKRNSYFHSWTVSEPRLTLYDPHSEQDCIILLGSVLQSMLIQLNIEKFSA